MQKNKLVTFMDQIPETPFHEEYETIECLQALEPLDSKYRLVVILYYIVEEKKSQRYMDIKLRRNVPNDDSK